ncbi:MAG: CRISPR-associated protein Cas4 [Thermodesulfobacteria bacterium]|nr:CRISPR-associated protein Cas4 [Thermodesulfobacteriota bacterium]
MLKEHFTGTQIAYFVVCKRKLWLFSHQIGFEKYSDYVELGRLINEESFKKETHKEVELGEVKIDFIKTKNGVIVHEVKKSRKLEPAHIWQVKYYIFKLRELGVNCSSGIIHYPKLFKKIQVDFTSEDEEIIKNFKREINEILSAPMPPVINKPYCKKCSYYEFCYS